MLLDPFPLAKFALRVHMLLVQGRRRAHCVEQDPIRQLALCLVQIATLGHGQVQLQVHALLAMQGHGLRLRQHLAPHVLLGHTLTLLARQRYQLARRVQLGLTQLLHQLRAQTARLDTILRVVHPRA